MACFPAFEGAAFSSATEILNRLKLIPNNCSSSVQEFFSKKSCYGSSDSKYCSKSLTGDSGAFHCLRNEGDVAFMNLETFKNLTGWQS